MVEARDRRSVMVTTPTSVKSFMLKLIELLHKLDMSRVQRAEEREDYGASTGMRCDYISIRLLGCSEVSVPRERSMKADLKPGDTACTSYGERTHSILLTVARLRRCKRPRENRRCSLRYRCRMTGRPRDVRQKCRTALRRACERQMC